LKDVGFKYRESGLIVQALKALGQERVDDAVITTLRKLSERYGDGDGLGVWDDQAGLRGVRLMESVSRMSAAHVTLLECWGRWRRMGSFD
jgi:hypothetical protein